MRWLYTLVLHLALPFALTRHAWRARRQPLLLRGLAERLGFHRRATTRPIWIHAVSVGEVEAARPLLTALAAHPVWLTTTTATGQLRARTQPHTVGCGYFPYDLPGAVRRTLDRVQPRLIVLMETELWPNLLRACAARRIPVILANARLSARSAARYARIPRATQGMLRGLHLIAAQTPQDAARFIALGTPATHVHVIGNLKYDLTPSPVSIDAGKALRAAWGIQRPVWIAASTHEGEEHVVLAAHAEILRSAPRCLLILVPRHPERFARVASLVDAHGLACARRSLNQKITETTPLYLADTLGELPLLYAAADVAFLGGSLVPVGGHNMLEAAAQGLPVLTGPHTHNFAAICTALTARHALTVVNDSASLATAVLMRLQDPARHAVEGAAARIVVTENQGATQRLMALLQPLVTK